MRLPKTESCRTAFGTGATVLLAVAVLLALVPAPACPAGEAAAPSVVQGEEWALYDVSSIRGEPYCLPYANCGYSLEIRGTDPVSRRVMVRSRPGDLECRAVFPPVATSFPPSVAVYAPAGGCAELAALSRRLTAGSRTQYQAVNRVLCWLSGFIEYRCGAGVPTNPLAVYRQGRASCVGASELAVALLREAGIPARGVRGFLTPGSGSVTPASSLESRELSLGEEGLHRWIEVYYPGLGWIFSDPFCSVNFVSPRYLVFDLEAPPIPCGISTFGGLPLPARFERLPLQLNEPESTFIRILDRGGRIIQTDVLPGLAARPGMTVRRNEPVQYRPAFVGRLDGAGNPAQADEVRLVAEMAEGRSVSRVAAVRQGYFSFIDLDVGAYQLHFYRDGVFVGAQRARVHFPPQGSGAVKIQLGE